MTASAETADRIATELTIGPQAIEAYSRLSYTMWHALAEFIDNSTQSRINYDNIIDSVLKQEGTPLVVDIVYNKLTREISVRDNSIGMTRERLAEALKIAQPTKDSRGRSKYGLGMKTAACWIGRRWKVITTEWGSGEEWTAEVDVKAVAAGNTTITLSRRAVDSDSHYTEVIISDLNRNIQKRTEENVRGYLGSMYRFDIIAESLKILFDGEEITAPEEYDLDTDPSGKPMRLDVNLKIGDKTVTGWVGVLRKGGRKFGGFSLFQNKRQIQGFPHAWKPRSIFGGVDDEGANNLVAQRLAGVINLDGFQVSHTKDQVLFEGNEEDELEKYLIDLTKDYRNYAEKRRGARSQLWSREKVRDLVQTMSKEFTSTEMSDVVAHSVLPPLETILANNQRQLASLDEKDLIATIAVGADLKVHVSLQEKSEYEPHVVIVTGADPNTIHVIINGLHPYYANLETTDAIDECVRQYIYDAIAEYRVSRLQGRVTPESVRRFKNDLLRVHEVRINNAAAALQDGDIEAVVGGSR